MFVFVLEPSSLHTLVRILNTVFHQLDDGEGDQEKDAVEEEENDGDADASDAKRRSKQEEEVRAERQGCGRRFELYLHIKT